MSIRICRGTITMIPDELVPDTSVRWEIYLSESGKSYTEIPVYGEDTQHSDLPIA